jgi:hypothetical protein
MRTALIGSAACLAALAALPVIAQETPASIRGGVDAGAVIAGHVTDSSSAPVSSYSVVVFPIDRTKWFVSSRFLRLARPTQDGSFEVTGLPPGEYWIAATDPIDGTEVSGDWFKPETLEQLSFRAMRVTLTERERFMTVLRLIRR